MWANQPCLLMTFAISLEPNQTKLFDTLKVDFEKISRRQKSYKITQRISKTQIQNVGQSAMSADDLGNQFGAKSDLKWIQTV